MLFCFQNFRRLEQYHRLSQHRPPLPPSLRYNATCEFMDVVQRLSRSRSHLTVGVVQRFANKRICDMSATPSSCPKCGCTDVHVAQPLKSHINSWLVIFGGILLSVLWGVSRKEEMRCNQCARYLSNPPAALNSRRRFFSSSLFSLSSER